MVTDKSTDLSNTIDRILKERLDQFNVPTEIRSGLRREILAFFQRPEVTPYGAAVMTPEASIAADQARKDKRTQAPGTNTPKII